MADLPPPDPRRPATALAYALLAEDWRRETVLAQVRARLVQAEPSGTQESAVTERLREVADEVLHRFPRPPHDEPAALVALLAGSEAVRELLAYVRSPAVLRPTETAMVRNPWSLPRLDDVDDLAGLVGLDLPRLLWLADPQRRHRRTRPGPLHPYERVWVRRGDRLPRLLEAPTPVLKRAQRTLLAEVVGVIGVHPAAHGFVPGRSVVGHAARHQGSELVIGLDLRSFFASVSAPRVRGLFRAAGYPEAVAALLAGLCTTEAPVRVLSAMPAGGTLDERTRLRTLLRAGHLAQGAPTSPALANAVCHGFDRRLEGYAAACGLRYTRYADDLAFSGPAPSRARIQRFLTHVGAVVAEEGFALNPAKTRVSRRGERQQLTGLVVNERANVPRRELDRLRAVLHDAVRHGPAAANRAGHPDFRAHLEGRVSWAVAVNPVRARRASELLARIRWDEDPG